MNYRAFYTKEEIDIEYTNADGTTAIKSERADPGNPDHMEALMKQTPRKMYVQVLKCRMNEPGGKLFLAFDAAHSTFTPMDTRTPPGFRELDNKEPLPDGWEAPAPRML